MAGFNPIGDVGRTLRTLLLDGMGTWSVDDEQIALTSPAQFAPDEVGLSLHLYHLAEDPHWANERPSIDGSQDPRAAPLVLGLSYLITAHPPDGDSIDTTDTLEQHRMLSKAIQTFRRHATIDDPDLVGSLAGGPALQVSVEDESDRVHDVWSTFQELPYLPSVSYRVTPLVIDIDEPLPDQRVLQTNIKHGEMATEETS